MLKRINKVTFRLTDTELARLRSRVHKSRLSQEAYLRQIMDGLIPQDAPPPEYHAMTRELYAIGNDLNQLAHAANATADTDGEKIKLVVTTLNTTLRAMNEAVVMPRKVNG